MYLYIKALHIIFIVTWFAGMFYIVRLFIYNTEAAEKTGPEREILGAQFKIMIRRLWLGITWPSALLTLIFGPWIWILMRSTPDWLAIKLVFVVLLYLYHFSLHILYREQQKGIFRYSSQKLRIWNEVATLLLFAIVFLATAKQVMSLFFGIAGIVSLTAVLILAIRIYKKVRTKNPVR
ncbi:MAG TPA: protoporphyrinogen IX oxidase [Chitinophagaceae bacterium]|nr:protoporphyrinogen IX oxidase [Chitinophagaceae bacterium]